MQSINSYLCEHIHFNVVFKSRGLIESHSTVTFVSSSEHRPRLGKTPPVFCGYFLERVIESQSDILRILFCRLIFIYSISDLEEKFFLRFLMLLNTVLYETSFVKIRHVCVDQLPRSSNRTSELLVTTNDA